MATHPQRTTWTDERLDDLSQQMRDGFARNDAEHEAIRREMRDGFDRVDRRFEQVGQRFEQVDQRFDQIDQRFDRVDQRFDLLSSRIDSFQLALIVGMIGLVGAIIASSFIG